MRQLTAFLILLAASLVAASPAQACMYLAQPRHSLWKEAPSSYAADEVALEVRYLTRASHFVISPDFDEGEEAWVAWTSCYTENHVFEVVKVLRGSFPSDRIVLRMGDYATDIPINPFATRVLVGTITMEGEFAPYLPLWRTPGVEDFVQLPFISPRLPPLQPKPFEYDGDFLRKLGVPIAQTPQLLWLGVFGSGPLTGSRGPPSSATALTVLVCLAALAWSLFTIGKWTRKTQNQPPTAPPDS